MPRIINNDPARFWSKIIKSGPIPKHKPELGQCWTWTGSFVESGYAQFWTKSGFNTAHRFSFVLHKGPVPEGCEVDHECRNRGCCNPAHLRALTHRDNVLTGDTIPAQHAAKSHCLRGHPFTAANTYVNPRGERQCRECMSLRAASTCGRSRGVMISGPRKLTEDQVLEMLERFDRGESYQDLVERFSVSYSTVEKILRGARWAHLRRPRYEQMSLTPNAEQMAPA